MIALAPKVHGAGGYALLTFGVQRFLSKTNKICKNLTSYSLGLHQCAVMHYSKAMPFTKGVGQVAMPPRLCLAHLWCAVIDHIAYKLLRLHFYFVVSKALLLLKSKGKVKYKGPYLLASCFPI